MDRIQESEARDVAASLYKFITSQTRLFDTLAHGKAVWQSPNYVSEMASVAKKAGLYYAQPGSNGFTVDGVQKPRDEFKTFVFNELKNKFVKEHTKYVNAKAQQFDAFFTKVFMMLARDSKLKCSQQVTETFGMSFYKQQVNESFERIYNECNS